MTITSHPLRNLTRTVLAASLAAGGLIAAAPTSEAALSHVNTNPYTTGCADTKRLLTSKAVKGGTASVYQSTSCLTLWLEYDGVAGQAVYKKTWDENSKVWTQMEIDKVAWSYSMQSYAPGTTKFIGLMTTGGVNYSVTCTSGCTWESSAPTSSTLSAKVDAFVKRWNGVYINSDDHAGAQCGDIPIQYRKEVVGANAWDSSAKDASDGGVKNWWYNAVRYGRYDSAKWTLVSASSAPRKGDVAVWNWGTLGHTALVLGDNGSTLKVFTQNPGAARVDDLSKSGLLGYFRPKM
ncbi:CHAP domain-containing protein [Aestuariimicrobium sp. p3-SID1156]|uniref:CHAP domain-containing protein n=1 Tax=Aestuariimicrobium sp. p3-SID1156 TaxID=2916038 RepID=UPI00223BE703|nr:CHAP domain-containing protein [Aestuariimicrobium sp. p3-SID1156]MCT1460282.1 CHAP domain-containing protein [Aestuariimicrobium sp. p3-SID1156]